MYSQASLLGGVGVGLGDLPTLTLLRLFLFLLLLVLLLVFLFLLLLLQLLLTLPIVLSAHIVEAVCHFVTTDDSDAPKIACSRLVCRVEWSLQVHE